ncbi:hypothetical protein IC235_01770 [Hymenobacter sp. BT664]|uniref:Lipoprotein n=1 Tax=Hymenobacter montanus TaxID=2771359 RepID=A0A927BAS7_9BACT|nr:DUF6252 family protein [Hymenobacter montanus]MBD2766618.1 hypothetical protein [Hymenobacter montanus]
MKFTLRFLRIATTVLVFASLAACSRKNLPPTMYMSWTVDGTNMKAESHTAAPIGNVIIASGTAKETPTGIYLTLPKSVGTYPAPPSTSVDAATYRVSNSDGTTQDYKSTSGTIVVTSITDKTIVGTFTFTGSDGTVSKNVTNGKFSLNF